MFTNLLCILLAVYVISSSIVLYYEWRVYKEIPLGKTLIKVALLVVAIINFPVASNFDEELEKNSAEITRVTVTNTETNETLFSAEGNLSVHTSGTSTSTWGFLGFFTSNTSSSDSYLTITIKTGKNANSTYKIRLSEKIAYFVETIDQSPDDPYYYKITNNISQLTAENES